MQQRFTMTAFDWLLLCVLSLCWGGSFIFTEIAVKEIPPLLLALCRCAIAAAFLLVYVRASGLSLPRDGATWRSLIVMSALNTVIPFVLIFWSQQYISSGLASILNASAPLSSIIVAHLATSDEKLTGPRAAGVTIGFLGVIVVIGPDALTDLGLQVIAQLAMVGGAFFYAASGVYGRRFHNVPPAVVASSILLAGAVMLLPLVVIFDRPWTLPVPSTTAMASAVGLALVSTAFAFLVYFRVLARAGAVNLQLVSFLIPISAIAMSVGILGETLQWRQIVGIAVIFAGLAVMDGRLQRLLQRRPEQI